MKSIDDDLEPPVPTPSTIRPRVKNKGKQCVFRYLPPIPAKSSLVLRSESVLPDAAVPERRAGTARYLT